MKDNKHRIWEMMQRLDPNFKDEQQVQQQTDTSTGVPSDVTSLDKALQNSTSVLYSLSRIDTPQELESALKTIIGSTGLVKKKSITISQAQTLLKNAMQSLGFQ